MSQKRNKNNVTTSLRQFLKVTLHVECDIRPPLLTNNNTKIDFRHCFDLS